MRFLFAVSLLFVACSPTEAQQKRSSVGSACPSNNICGEGLDCNPYTNTCEEYCAKDSDCPRGTACHNEWFLCVSPVHVKCSRACNRKGKCDLVLGSCEPTKDEHCAKSEWCKTRGRCSLVDGWCKATKVEHCAKSEWCKEKGRCSLNDEQWCVTE